jgi:hypothetical protein
MAIHTFDVAVFRQLYPAFANAVTFTDVYLQAQWDAATVYLGEYDGRLWGGKALQLALNLMTAHLVQINLLITQGGKTPTIGILVSATVDKVTVSKMPPPATNGWKYWL